LLFDPLTKDWYRLVHLTRTILLLKLDQFFKTLFPRSGLSQQQPSTERRKYI
jgi:hypothetical protein